MSGGDTRRSVATAPAPSPADVVRIAARAHERDRYLAALLAPAAARDGLMALAAFAGEIHRIPATVSEPMAAAIRLQWWRDAIAEPDGTVSTGHPIADAMRTAIRAHALPLDRVAGFIDAVSDTLADDPIPDDTALAAYLGETESALYDLALTVLAGPAEAASHAPLVTTAGRASGLTRLLGELPAHVAESRPLLPRSRLAAAGLTLEALRADTTPAALAPLLDGLAAEARRALGDARRMVAALPGPLRTAFLPLALVEPHLRLLRKPGHDPLRHIAELLPVSRVWRLWWMHKTGRI